MRVVVVGAGFAGLMAACRVAQAGRQVAVLEARNRVGGRVWSQELIPGDPCTIIERGAEFVLDGYDLMRGVLGELGLGLAGMAMSFYEREPRGGAALRIRTWRAALGPGRCGRPAPARHAARRGVPGWRARPPRSPPTCPGSRSPTAWLPGPWPPRRPSMSPPDSAAANLAGGRRQPAGGPGAGRAPADPGLAAPPGPPGGA